MRRGGIAGKFALGAIAAALVASGLMGFSGIANAQSSGQVPAARFYGAVNGGAGGATVTASVGGTVCGTGSASNGSYFVDIQSVSGCTTSGAKVNFRVGSAPATQVGTIPDVMGTAVHLDLTVGQATATPGARATARTAPPPPPAPPVVRTTAAPPPPPRPPVVATARPATATVVRPAAQAPKAAQGPVKGPVRAQGPKAAQAPRAAAAPRLPSTGTGGLLDQQSNSSGMAGLELAMIMLAALGIGASGLVAYRRSH